MLVHVHKDEKFSFGWSVVPTTDEFFPNKLFWSKKFKIFQGFHKRLVFYCWMWLIIWIELFLFESTILAIREHLKDFCL